MRISVSFTIGRKRLSWAHKVVDVAPHPNIGNDDEDYTNLKQNKNNNKKTTLSPFVSFVTQVVQGVICMPAE